MNEWLSAVVHELQRTPVSMDRVQRSATVVKASNDRVAQAGLALCDMKDNPGSFESWCRGFVASVKLGE